MASRCWLTLIVVECGALSRSGSDDVGYVLLIPFSAALFQSVGRYLLVGIAGGGQLWRRMCFFCERTSCPWGFGMQEAVRALTEPLCGVADGQLLFFSISVFLAMAVGRS